MERVVVVGASAGGIPALEAICAELPSDFAAPILVAMHVGPQGNDLLEVLAKCCRLPASHAIDGQYAEAGTILVAAPGRNLTIVNDHGKVRVRLVEESNPNLLAPAINPLFASAAAEFRERVVGTVLSGFLDDGSEGLRAVKAAGGVAIAQEPRDALCPDMPANAIRQVAVDSILRADAIGAFLTALAATPAAAPSPAHAGATAPGRAPVRQGHGIEVGNAGLLASSALSKPQR
ncbi:two-component system, chemotaxis family, response regulator CheB [Duganella sp. CF517]|nr:two-component system, chemotaxis family, response regulator CheB [Duganella sp. CF517]